MGPVFAKKVNELTMEASKIGNSLTVIDWGLMPYDIAFNRQIQALGNRIAGDVGDQLHYVEHLPVVTVGRSGSHKDLCVTKKQLFSLGGQLCFTDRGGKATYHGPGQLVVYPVIELLQHDLHLYVDTLLEVTAEVLRTFGLNPVRKKGQPGLWVNGAKIASIGVAVKRWVTYHGVALNVNPNLQHFGWIVPCGQPNEVVTSMEKQLNQKFSIEEVKAVFSQHFKRLFDYPVIGKDSRPNWLKLASPKSESLDKMEELLDGHKLATVCQSAHCPNLGECFNRGTATFLILGEVCTRNCRFCAVQTGLPTPPNPAEPEYVASAAKKLGLKYVVVTTVTRDDLEDGGASHFISTIEAIRRNCPDALIEVLVSDFNGDCRAVGKVCSAWPDMFNHNIETVPRLYPLVRPKARFERSLDVLRIAAQKGLSTKSGLMLGLGEQHEEVRQTLIRLRECGCEHLTLGQYLAPSNDHYPIVRYITPAEFDKWAQVARDLGFKEVASGPLVRSSYRADEHFAMVQDTKSTSYNEVACLC